MGKVYIDAEDKNVAGVICFNANGTLVLDLDDPTGSKVSADKARHWFECGMLKINSGTGDLFVPHTMWSYADHYAFSYQNDDHEDSVDAYFNQDEGHL